MFEDEANKAIDEALEERKKFRRRLKRCLVSGDGDAVLAFLEGRFEVNIPAFQGSKGNYDPLDAMRRDAYREVFLFIRREISLASVNEDEEETNDQ